MRTPPRRRSGKRKAQVQQYQAQIDRAVIVSPVTNGFVHDQSQSQSRRISRLAHALHDSTTQPSVRGAQRIERRDVHHSRGRFRERRRCERSHARVQRQGCGRSRASGTRINQFHRESIAHLSQSRRQITIRPPPVTASITLPAVTGIGVPTTSFLDDTHTALMIEDDQLDETVAKTVHVHERASNGTASVVTGLKGGEHVISNGQLGLTDGQSIDDPGNNNAALKAKVRRHASNTHSSSIVPRSVFVALALIGLAGCFALATLVQQSVPNIDFPTVNVSVSYPGASPSELRDSVVRPVEDAIAGAPDLDHISTSIQQNQASISATFHARIQSNHRSDRRFRIASKPRRERAPGRHAGLPPCEPSIRRKRPS